MLISSVMATGRRPRRQAAVAVPIVHHRYDVAAGTTPARCELAEAGIAGMLVRLPGVAGPFSTAY
jgi:hypothetical protein